MTPRTHQVASRQLLHQAKEELAAGDVHQASENGWGAVPTSAACCYVEWQIRALRLVLSLG